MKYSRRTSEAILSLIIISLFSAHPVLGQVKKRIIPFPEWLSSSGEDNEIRLEVIEIKVAGKPVVLGQPFDADDNWLKNMTLRVKNVSGKAIIAFGVAGGLLKGVDDELQPSENYKYIIAWVWGKEFDPEKEKPKGVALKPGETVELSYANVIRLYPKPLDTKGEGGSSRLKFRSPSLQYEDGTSDFLPHMKFYGSSSP